MMTTQVSSPPPKELSHLIREFHYLPLLHHTAQQHKAVVDDACYDFVFLHYPNATIQYAKQQEIAIDIPVFTIHQLPPPHQFFFEQSGALFVTKVQPWANRLCFPLKEKMGIIDLVPYYGNSIEQLHQAIFAASSFQEKKDLAVQYLKQQDWELGDKFYFIKSICERIYQAEGMISVNELAEQYQIDRQSLNKLFSEQVCYTIKKFIIIVRIMAAIKAKINQAEASFTEIAHQFGYYDQAHFNYDFKRICGISPSALFKNLPQVFARHKK